MALLIMLGLQARVRMTMVGPPPRTAEASLDEFSAARAYQQLRQLLGDQQPHPVGTAANARVRQRLVAQLQQMGLDVEVQRQRWQSDPPLVLYNVLARLPGTPDRGRPLVLATHYDSVPAGPGAADAGSCAVTLLETARVLLRGGPYERPVYFLFTDGEEAGLLGAQAFVETHALSQAKPFVMNFEARGTSGASLMFETHRGNLAAIGLLARHLPAPCATGSSFVTVYRVLPNDTDFTIFQRAGWTGLNFAFIDDAHHYHTASDNLENLSLRSLQHHGNNAVALAKAIATNDAVDLDASRVDAVFFDVLGYRVIAFPQSWALPLSLVPLALLLIRRGKQLREPATWWTAARVASTVLLAIASAAAAGWLGTRMLQIAGVLPRAHVPWGGFVAVSYVPIALMLVWLAARLCVRRVPADRLWWVFWTLWSAAAVGLTAATPGFSYFLLVPAFAASLLILFARPLGLRACGSVLATSLVFLPVANQLPVSLGPAAAAIYHPVFVLLWLPLLPWCAAWESPLQKNRAEANDPT